MDDTFNPLTLPASVLLKAVLRAYGWTHKDLAAEMDCHPATIGAWRRGESEPRLSEAQKLRELLQKAPSPVEGALAEEEKP